MSTKKSVSLILVWRVAELEALQLKAVQIEPMHLLLSLAKCVDLDLAAVVPKDAKNHDETLEQLLREISRVREVFRAANIQAKGLRRRLRKSVPEGRFVLSEPELLHRSNEAKKVFVEAQRLAAISDQLVYPVHLLLAVLSGRDQLSCSAMEELGISETAFRDAAHREIFGTKRRRIQLIGDSKVGRN